MLPPISPEEIKLCRNSRLYYTFFDSPFGEIYINATDMGIFSIILNKVDEIKINELVTAKFGISIQRDDNRFEKLYNQLSYYFSGKPIAFDCKLDLRGVPIFQQRIWRVVQQVPYGKLYTYKWVAEQLGIPKSYRAIGQALSQNPLPIVIPCHRIVRCDNKLGGYSGGMEWKRNLILHERGQNRIYFDSYS